LSVKIGSIFSVPVRLHFTLILAVLLIAWTLAASFMPAEYPGLSSIQYWVIGVIGAIGLFASVLIHELSHSYVAEKNGLPVKQIVLFIFGGVSEIEEEPKDPGLEFKMAFVGPASSFAIGIVLYLAWFLLSASDLSPLIIAPMEYLGMINLLLGGFNLLPAFPIDGGRVLRAVLWKRKNNFIGATKTATRVGVAFSYLFIFGGLALIFFGSLINGVWFMLIGWFLKNGAESSLKQTVVSEALAGVALRDIMTRDVHTVDPDTSVKDVLETRFLQDKHGGFPVEKDSKLLGLITLEDIRKSPREKWSEIKVGDVMTTCEKLKCASPDEPAVDAFMKMSKQDIGRLPVQEDGKLVGIVTRSDILHAIRVRTELTGKQ
jgi:Zn-dependent protease/CBS domain-containing protein